MKNETTEALLLELSSRGGHAAVLADAALLAIRKSQDYNSENMEVASYFPFGVMSYAQMIHIKAMRFVSLSTKENVNYEGLRDTALDLINYSAFFLRGPT